MKMGTKKKKLVPDDPGQSARFIETVERIGLVDDPESAFQEAAKRIIRSKKTEAGLSRKSLVGSPNDGKSRQH